MGHDVAVPFLFFCAVFILSNNKGIDMRMEGNPLGNKSSIELNALISLAYSKAVEFYLRYVLLRKDYFWDMLSM